MGTYSADQIDWLRPPEVEGEQGNWMSRWLLTVRSSQVTPAISTDLHPDVLAVEISSLGNSDFRLELRTSSHPLDPEGYPAVDAVLRSLDASLGLIQINGSERDKWRPFR